ncbi:anaphase-promoting complex subunit 10 isoform X3 [Ananas comosus]|uniref:Anaphase-promoting complex subunit 10 isoform X3 n=1 Tax=Ananas comosus TaxID=4615 RepID=A0A6P5GH41_ANACO|nr:anaphase-promoting complex subunit 10 isoform X3 [Ananas comosus]
MATESEGEEETAAAGVGGKLTGSPQLAVDGGDLREMAKKAAWSVSSCKPGNGVVALRDDNLDTYWQSDGAQPHLVNIQFQRKLKLQLVVLYVDFKLDESYTPSKISVRAGDSFHNLKEIKTVELVKPVGWVHISLSGTDPRCVFSPSGCTSVSNIAYFFDIILAELLVILAKHLFTPLCSNLPYCPIT